MFKKVLDQKLADIRNNSTAIAAFAQGLELIKKSTVLDFLTLSFKAQLVQSATPMESNAIAGAYASGASDAFECLVHFQTLFLETLLPGEVPRMDFNSLDVAVKKGTLTKEEADAIRTGKQPDYARFIKTTSNVPTGNISK